MTLRIVVWTWWISSFSWGDNYGLAWLTIYQRGSDLRVSYKLKLFMLDARNKVYKYKSSIYCAVSQTQTSGWTICRVLLLHSAITLHLIYSSFIKTLKGRGYKFQFQIFLCCDTFILALTCDNKKPLRNQHDDLHNHKLFVICIIICYKTVRHSFGV